MSKPELQSSLQDANDALTHLTSLLDTIVLVLQSKNGLFFFAILVGVITWYTVFKANPNGLLTYFETRRRSRTERLEKYLSSSQASDAECVNAIREIYDAECFEQATGIYAELERRTAIISLHNRAAPLVTWQTIRKAKDYIDFDQGNCAIIENITIWHRIHYWMNIVIGSFLFLIGLFSIILLPFFPGDRFLNFLTAVMVFLIFLGLALVSLSHAQPYRCATLIKKALDTHGN